MWKSKQKTNWKTKLLKIKGLGKQRTKNLCNSLGLKGKITRQDSSLLSSRLMSQWCIERGIKKQIILRELNYQMSLSFQRILKTKLIKRWKKGYPLKGQKNYSSASRNNKMLLKKYTSI